MSRGGTLDSLQNSSLQQRLISKKIFYLAISFVHQTDTVVNFCHIFYHKCVRKYRCTRVPLSHYSIPMKVPTWRDQTQNLRRNMLSKYEVETPPISKPLLLKLSCTKNPMWAIGFEPRDMQSSIRTTKIKQAFS